ncbi:hypothetical protein Lnau_3076 [Legionella nautarum]|uniref:Uncharacterized protein n=1 Tax=Legionella nautarum TaxID=45070 RepID=A0A0W0WIN1_9GAMM|nr:hypothetical protein [Legionella nautarum]KTD32165.1 hypothetical protein Lnau_3076 [Legionella nautarum]
MKRNFTYPLIGIFFFLSTVVYADNPSLGKVINHREWVTGNLKLNYTISNAKQKTINHINPKFADDVKEYVHSGHLITSIDTKYDYPYQTISKIDSTFWVDIHGFETTNEPQLFTVLQETCIDPRGDTTSNQSTCVNSEDTIFVDDISRPH